MSYGMNDGLRWTNNWFKLQPEDFEKELIKWCQNQKKIKQEKGSVDLLIFDHYRMVEYGKINGFVIERHYLGNGTAKLQMGGLIIVWDFIENRAQINRVVRDYEERLYVAPENYSQVNGITYINPDC